MLTKLSPRCPRQGKAPLWLAAEASCSSSCCHNSTSRSARSTTRQVHRLLLATRTWRGHQGIQTLGRFFERRRYAGCHLSLAYATSPSADKQCERVWRGSGASSSAEHASAQGVADRAPSALLCALCACSALLTLTRSRSRSLSHVRSALLRSAHSGSHSHSLSHFDFGEMVGEVPSAAQLCCQGLR